MIRISIIVPVYNAETTLERLLTSLLSQKEAVDYEIILVDDGSTDHSPQICDQYEKQSPNIRVIHQQNAGPSAARNTGLSVAAGEYVMFCDADDYVERNTLLELSKTLSYDILIYGVVDESWQDGIIISSCSHVPEARSYRSTALFLEDFHYLLENNLLYSQCTKLYKKQIIDANHIQFDPDLTMGEDITFNLLYFEHINTAKLLDYAFYHYTHLISSTSISNSFYPGYYENVSRVLHKQKDLLHRFGKMSEVNYLALESFFVGRISSAIQNEYLQSSIRFSHKLASIKQISSTDEAREAVKAGRPRQKLHRLLAFFLRHHLYLGTALLYQIVVFIKSDVKRWMAGWKKRSSRNAKK